QRTAGQALRNPERLRQRLPPCDGREVPPGPARSRQLLDNHVGAEPDFAGDARFVDSRKSAWKPPAVPSTERASAAGKYEWPRRDGSGNIRSRTYDPTPGKSALQRMPSIDGSHRTGIGKLRRDRAVAQ